jgi:N-acetylglutamate synthase-like GNAT family acetyltransferase/SAM-dependent methyltransferase
MTTTAAESSAADVKASVRQKYGQAAQRVMEGNTDASCCGSSGCCGATSEAWDPITADLYEEGQKAGVPAEALLASLGCGNPTALAQLNEGETVLDLGSGGGIDVLLSAKRVGPTGKVYGLDMTDEMLALANANKQRAGAANVEFLKGEIEHIPLPDHSVDVIISNCVINLSADKARVLREAYRVLKPGGRFAVSDVVVHGEAPAEVRRNMEMWMGCVAGALEEMEYRDLLADAGFRRVEIEPTRIYQARDAEAFLAGSGLDPATFAAQIDGKFMSAFIRGVKPRLAAQPKPLPTAGACCGSDCCSEEDPMTAAATQPYTIRPATTDDLPGVIALLEASSLPTVGVAEALRGFLVAEREGTIIGSVGIETCCEQYALLRSTAVSDDWRGRGLGRRLVESAIAAAEAKGVEALYLLTTTAESYFPSFGFERIRRDDVPAPIRATDEFRSACPASATVMTLSLEPKTA